MRRTLIYTAVVAVALVLSVGGAVGLASPRPDPARPGATPAPVPAAGIGQISAGASDLSRTLAALQERVERLPGDDGSWAALGLAYVEQARLTGDPTYYDLAERAVETSFDVRRPDNAAAHASAAALAAARHDFTSSLREADRALAISPYDARALAVRVDALTELGRYDAQLRALEVADRRHPGLPVMTRYAYAEELRGDLAAASSLLRRSLSGAGPADRGFLLTQLAELDRRRGDLGRADRRLDDARAAAPDYLPAQVSQARLAVARGQHGRAERLWRQVVARVPAPEYLVELGELLLHRGATAAAAQQFDVVRATARLQAENGVGTDLETAVFEADHGSPRQALRMARAAWSERRSVVAADALAWALHGVGRDRDALPLARAATRLGTAEAAIWIHRGTIEAALERDAAAVRHLRRGLAADAGLSPWQAAKARAVLDEVSAR